MKSNKTITFLASVAIVSVLLPSIALAHDNSQGDDHEYRARFNISTAFHSLLNWRHDMNMMRPQVKSGTVTAIGTTSFTLRTSDGTVYTVNTENATITGPFSQTTLTLSDITVNESAYVTGTISDSTITAKHVTITPQNTHPAVAKGTVTAVNGNAVTIQSQHAGVVYSVTVNTNANTSVQTQTGTSTATSTVASIQVGDKISAKGLWDEVLNILNAIKIKLFKS